MEAEKRLVNIWLNKNGFFTINNINTGKHVIDILAIKFKEGRLEKIQHVEVICSISADFPLDAYKKNFENKEVSRKIVSIIEEYVASHVIYEKVLVTNSKLSQEKLGDIKLIRLSDILYELFLDIDTQNYEDSILRTFQLFKYIILTHERISSMTQKIKKKEIRRILSEGLDRKDSLRMLSRNEEAITTVFKKSLYRRDMNKLATLLNENLTVGQRNELIERIAKRPKGKIREYKEKSLDKFY